MQTSKEKIVRRLLSLVFLIALVAVAVTLIGRALEPVSYATYFNRDIKAMEEKSEDADLVFVGASRVYRTFVPSIFEKELGISNVVNAGSSAQPLSGTYYELKDMIERVHPKRVIIGVTFDELTSDELIQGKSIVYDRLSTKNKIEMGLKEFHGSEKLYLLKAYRFRDNLSDYKSIRANWDNLKANNYKAPTTDSEYYAENGFVYSQKSLPAGKIEMEGAKIFSEAEIKDENLEYLDECLELCKKNNIRVSLVTGPTTVDRLCYVENYQGAVDFYENYAKENDVKYYNLNYLRGRVDFLPNSLMADYNHVNGKGAEIVSQKFAEILKKEDAGENVSQYFYKNLDELKRDIGIAV